MPNWYSNELTITGETTLIDGVIESVKRNNGKFFDYLRPMPKYLLDRLATVGDDAPYTWYDWRMDNWGVKWEPNSTHIISVGTVNGSKQVTLTFETAWSPPVDLYQFLDSVGIEVEATFVEPMMGFRGTYKDYKLLEIST